MANIWIELKFLFGFWNVSDRRLWFSFFSNNEYYTILGISGNLTKRSSRFRNWSNNLFFGGEKYMYIYNRTFRGFLRDSIRNLIECHFAVVDNIRFSPIKVQILFAANAISQSLWQKRFSFCDFKSKLTGYIAYKIKKTNFTQ